MTLPWPPFFSRLLSFHVLAGTLWCALALAAAEPPPGLDERIPIVAWQDAGKVVGRMAVVFGEIVDVGHTERIHFLNFKQHDRQAFTAVVFADVQAKLTLPLEQLYLHRRVEVRGVVTLFKGTPQIVITEPDQITLVDEFPKPRLPQDVEIHIGEELVLATYNVKNFFDDVDDPYRNDESTSAKPQGELRNVARVVQEINADVLVLQEVENRGFLQWFLDTMLPDMGYRYVVHYEGNDLRGIDVCVVSRIPVGAVTSYRHFVFTSVEGGEQRFNRDLLCVELVPDDGQPLEVWGVHLKSNSGGRELAEPIRLGEARAIRHLVLQRLQRDPAAAFVLCGDFNDTWGSPTLETIVGQEEPRLVPLFDEIPVEARITYNRVPYQNMIDFLLCSPAMAQRYVPATYAIRYGSDEDSGSDHNPVYCRFRKLGSATPAGKSDQPPAHDPGDLEPVPANDRELAAADPEPAPEQRLDRIAVIAWGAALAAVLILATLLFGRARD